MKVGNDGIIIEATKIELWRKYIDEEYDKEMYFHEFLEKCEAQGIKILDERSRK